MTRAHRTLLGLALSAATLLPFTAAADELPALTPSVELVERLTSVAPELTPAVAEVKETTLFGLPQNVGTADRVVRGLLAATLVGVGSYRLANDAPNPTLSKVLVGVAAVPAATGATGYCPLYQVVGIDTNF